MPPGKRTNRSGPEQHNNKKAKHRCPQVVTDVFNVNNGRQSSTPNALLSAIQDLIKKVDEQGQEIKELKRTSNISVEGSSTTNSSELSTSNKANNSRMQVC
jgi:hypothetical protein